MISRLACRGIAAGALCASLAGCSGDDNHAVAGSGGSSGVGAGGSGGIGGAVEPFVRPADPGAKGILFSVSGEDLAQSGYAFPPASADDPQFYDGWEMQFERLLVTVDKVVLSANADKDPGDQSKTDGPVAHVNGPWAIDLHHEDANNIDGKSEGERAIPIAALPTEDDGSTFATDGTRYAFGFDAVAATDQAINVNLDEAALADYREMTAEQCVVMYVGTATFKGDKTDASCYDSEHKSWPDVVSFRLCFRSPTTYGNCQNPDNTGAPFDNEESQRGIAFDDHASVIAQITFHTDHPFWDSVLHDAPAHFDQFAARALGQDGGPSMVTLDATRGADYTAYTDSLGHSLNWRYCSAPPTDVHPKFTGPMVFDPQTVPHALGADARTGLRDYYDFATYNQSTQGHLNADGLCAIKRNYDSPE